MHEMVMTLTLYRSRLQELFTQLQRYQSPSLYETFSVQVGDGSPLSDTVSVSVFLKNVKDEEMCQIALRIIKNMVSV